MCCEEHLSAHEGQGKAAMEQEERRKRLRRNIVLIQAMRSCKMMLFGITVNVTYFQSLGVSMWGVSPRADPNPDTS